MKANINGIEVEGTPKEISNYIGFEDEKKDITDCFEALISDFTQEEETEIQRLTLIDGYGRRLATYESTEKISNQKIAHLVKQFGAFDFEIEQVSVTYK